MTENNTVGRKGRTIANNSGTYGICHIICYDMINNSSRIFSDTVGTSMIEKSA